MNKKIIKLISAVLLGGSIGLMSFNVSVDAQIIILPNYGSTIYNPKINSIYSSYSNIYPSNELYGGATKVETRIEKEKWMTKNGLVPWWDDEYKEYESDIYVTFKYSKILDSTCETFGSNSDPLAPVIKIGESLKYTETITYEEEVTDSFEHVSTLSWEHFTKTTDAISAGATIGIVDVNASKSFEGGMTITSGYSNSQTHTIYHSKGRTKTFEIVGLEDCFYRWEVRGQFNMYTTYHFKAHYHMVESGRLWNSIYYNIVNDGYEFKDARSFTKYIDGTEYEGQIKYEMIPGEKFKYADIKRYPEQILYI